MNLESKIELAVNRITTGSAGIERAKPVIAEIAQAPRDKVNEILDEARTFVNKAELAAIDELIKILDSTAD